MSSITCVTLIVMFCTFVSTGNLSNKQSILNDLSWRLKVKFFNEIGTNNLNRRVGVQSLTMGRRQDAPESTLSPEDISPAHEDDGHMRVKLFRLMYETVRDSDLKVKRAELIKNQYANSTVFEIGYIIGDVTDKWNVMSDIALTLKRLYHEWKPIEHINAYEQIANQAIEIGQLVEMLRSTGKRDGA